MTVLKVSGRLTKLFTTVLRVFGRLRKLFYDSFLGFRQVKRHY